MIVISSDEFQRDTQKYLDIAAAKTERIVIRHKGDEYELYLKDPIEENEMEEFIYTDKQMDKHRNKMREEIQRLHRLRDNNDPTFREQSLNFAEWVRKTFPSQNHITAENDV